MRTGFVRFPSVLCAKSYKIKKNTAAAAAAASRSPAGGHRAASPVIGQSTVQVWLATESLLRLPQLLK